MSYEPMYYGLGIGFVCIIAPYLMGKVAGFFLTMIKRA